MTVRVHEALDASYVGESSRYFISVDLKFREHEALNFGKIGCYGMRKAEATKEANHLSRKLTAACAALNAAEELALNSDTFTNRYTVKLQKDRLNKLVGKYNSELVTG